MSEARILWVGARQQKMGEVIAFIEKSGYEVTHAEDSVGGLCKLYQNHTDLIVIGRSIPDEDGSESLTRLRELSYIPIIFLGDRNEAANILELGADSFVALPPDAHELKARIDYLLRRKRQLSPPGGGAESGTISNQGHTNFSTTNLTPTENRISNYLELNKGRVTGYAQLREEVWGGRSINVDTLHYYIRRLKAKLSISRIKQVRGVGYLMV